MILLQILIPLLWSGMIAGISFIEAPLKFKAPGITLPLGLGIGQLVFQTLNKVEWVLYIGWAGPILISGANTRCPSIIPIIGLILLLQSAWWLPHLDKRAVMIRQGIQPKGRSLHLFYALAEITKCILLTIYASINFINHSI